MVYTVFYKTSSFAGYCFLGKNSIHQKRYDVFSFKAFKLTLVKFQICSFIVIYELDYGRSYKAGMVTDTCGNDIDCSSAETVYDSLMKEAANKN